MTWRKYEYKQLREEDIEVPDIKRWQGEKILLPELLTPTYQVQKFFEDCYTALTIINRVIVEIKYPLNVFGLPTDFHYFQAFRYRAGKCLVTKRNELDYWQTAHETVLTRYGDCEDSSVLTTTGLLFRSFNSFVALGIVERDGEVLGGHAWTVVDLFGEYRLVETTLDEPYATTGELPRIDIERNEWYVPPITYRAYMLFNNKEVWVWEEVKNYSPKQIITGLKTMQKMERKNELRKYIEIENAWYRTTKPINEIRRSRIKRLIAKIRGLKV